jgi:murein DD-endopeptidase MepM/ murein hydrolase activator NlpD
MIERNGLGETGFERWAFYPEMLFGAQGKWWGDRGRRPRPHEGIDLGLYTDKAGQALRLPESSRIPVMFDGEIIKIEEDFLGESLYLGHEIDDGQGRQLFTIYGHTKPENVVRTGERFRQGEVIATLSPADRRIAGVPAHLHLSLAWVSKTQASEELNWELLHDPRVAILLDPLRVMDCPYKILAPDTPVNSC